MAPLNKLSINYVADAFTREEIHNGKVFVAFGQVDTILTVRRFLKAMGREPGDLWGATFVALERVQADSLLLGARPFGRETLLSDFQTVLDNLLEDGQAPTTEVWGRRLAL